MERESVESSNIAEVGYDAASATMEVMFHDGKVYQYFDVPAHVHDEMMHADSVGRFFSANIRGVFRFARV